MLHGSTGSWSGRSPCCQLQVSEHVAKLLDIQFQVKQQSRKRKRNNTNHVAVSRRVQGADKGSLFLGRLDQGLVGNAESTHVNRPKGKAPACSRCWKVLQYHKKTYKRITCDEYALPLVDLFKVGNEHIVSVISKIC